MIRNIARLAALSSIVAGLSCTQDLSPLNSTTTSYAPTPTPVVAAACTADNFDPLVGTLWWPLGPSPASESVSTDTAVSGANSWKVSLGAASAAMWGHWDGDSFSPPLSFPGATRFQMWYKSNNAFPAWWYFNEGTTNGADGEEWWTYITMIGDNAWHFVDIPLSSFTQTTTGSPPPPVVGMVPSPESVAQVWFYGDNPYTAVTFYIDDISFCP